MDVWTAVVPLAGLAILAISTVIITGMALKGTAPQDRAGILRAVAEVVREIRRRS
ncbi:hypothetical protein GCM10010129_57510 [Streptomyces fumigatiscleroticus]|nr:hypothetical protein GCM10010129_57510 [Streptomyces fumigatiscleroticus]